MNVAMRFIDQFLLVAFCVGILQVLGKCHGIPFHFPMQSFTFRFALVRFVLDGKLGASLLFAFGVLHYAPWHLALSICQPVLEF